jgi:hypothetical protein
MTTHHVVFALAVLGIGLACLAGLYVTNWWDRQEQLLRRRRAAEERQRNLLARAHEWTVNAVAHQNFAEEKFRVGYARTHLDDILKAPHAYLDAYQSLLKDPPLVELLKATHPEVLAVYAGRAETYHIAQRMQARVGTRSAEAYREKGQEIADAQMEQAIIASEMAFTQRIERLARLRNKRDELIVKYPDLKGEIERQYAAYEDEPPPAEEPRTEPGAPVEAPPQPPTPEVY